METAVSLNQIGLYNPQRQSAKLTEELFIARQKEFNLLMESLNEETPDSVPQHHLITAQRGMGKTTLLKRIEVELHKEKYRKRFIPLLPPEEQYNLSDLAELWLNCLDGLLESLEIENVYDKESIGKIENNIRKIKQEYKESSDLSEKLYKYLISACKDIGRRPILLIDNIGLAFHRLSKQEQNILRAYLSENGCPIVIGAGVATGEVTATKEHIINYKAPFYDFFQSHKLKRLDLNELIEILYNLSKVTQIEISINAKNKTHLQSLFQLTGGNPRTVVMLFKLLTKGFSESIVDDLEALLDESTPLNKSRFEELPTLQQVILNAIAQNWDPIHIVDLSEVTRYKSSLLSSQISRLIAAGWIETVKVDTREWDVQPKMSKTNKIKGNVYSISERFLSIWLIMRNGRRERKNDIRKVLESYEWIYGKENFVRNEKEEIKKEQFRKKIKDTCGKKQFDKAEKLLNTLNTIKTPKDRYCLEQTLFELYKRNEGIANNHLSEALTEIKNKLNPKTQGDWEYFAATTIKLGYAQWLLDILSEKGFDIILSPFFVAIEALEIERANNLEMAETYLKNQAIEKSELAYIIIERMKKFWHP